MRYTLAPFLAGLTAALVLCGCGQNKASLKADALELEKAFNLKPGVTPADDRSPAALAAKAVAAIRARDWPNAVSTLTRLRTAKGLTAHQSEVVHNANGNAYVQLAEMARKGNQDARATLEMLKKAASAR